MSCTTPQPVPAGPGLSESALGMGLRQSQLEQAPLPVVLWRYGLITLEQLDAVWAWQESQI